ncbi:MAG TPA: methionyl-tRNA formyltransferase [Candidatus Limnocylindrales bacterium]|nr:methionyl-tRNA formyltransferase [Candidatus Limnocylindrales bacterium]
MSPLRMVFCGTPQFAVPSLQKLIAQSDFEIAAVFTQPDRPRGRGQEVPFSAVKEVALAAQLPVQQPAKVRGPEVEEQLRKLAPEVVVIIAYGQIIPARLLTIPRLGWINLHASLLSKYRGAAPINWAIANGETITGNTTMHIDAGMDTGEILLQQELAIGSEETAPELSVRLAQAGADLMLDTLRGLQKGTITARPQNHSAATLAPILKREDGQIRWKLSAREIFNRMRGFAPWPGAFTEFRGQTCHVWGRPLEASGKASPLEMPSEPGGLLARRGEVLVTCGAATVLELTHVKLEGRKQVSALEFANGARLHPGERFGNR